MKIKVLICTLGAFFAGMNFASAKENIEIEKMHKAHLRTAAGCAPASSSVELDINNVRALLHNGGDMWWDLQGSPRYEVPKVDNPADKRYSSFAGSLWIGGIDEAGQLRVAAQTYRQSGNDFWPGPLTPSGEVTEDVCLAWNKHYVIKKEEISNFRGAFSIAQSTGSPINMADYPNVQDWPAFGEDSDGNRLALAPFVDIDGDPFNYTPDAGDYPDIRPCDGGGEPDQAIWWVINDKGDVHTETGGEAIGVEIQMLAFAFSTANAINDMTFYKYVVINKSDLKLNNCFMGQWVDSDVGNYQDDYVGCDTLLGLGFAYNGDANDEQNQSGYGLNPPAFGLDFFQGPFGDAGTRLPMQRFVYYENDFSLRGNPEVATHYYGYLIGKWKDGSNMTYGGDGHSTGAPTNFMFPGDPGFCGGAGDGGWSEVSSNRQPFDRRFLQSAGPFTLQPGAVNDIIVGAVWARKEGNANLGSVCALKEADAIAQALFDNCFRLLDGPDAPEITINEYDQELIVTWDYTELSKGVRNNYNESYIQADPVLLSNGASDPSFEFEGYMVFQLRNNTISGSQLFDTEKARLVAQCDLENGIKTIVNRTVTSVSGLNEPVIVDQIMVKGEDKGIFHSISLTEDEFATGTDRRLKNYTNYYYAVIAYAYNDTASDGRKFVQGNGFFANTPALPHKIDFENFGTTISSEYGTGIDITQIAGVGNGGNYVKITSATETSILNNTYEPNITYLGGYAPVKVKVVSPKDVKGSDYTLEIVKRQFANEADSIDYDSLNNVWIIDSAFTEWILYEGPDEIYRSNYLQRSGQGATFNRPEMMSGIERLIEGHGISISVEDVLPAGDSTYLSVIGADLTFSEPLYAWLTGVEDDDDFDLWDWLQCGGQKSDKGYGGTLISAAHVFDKFEEFEDLIGGTWGPYCMAAPFNNGDVKGLITPGCKVGLGPNADHIEAANILSLEELPDVDIVFTSDTTKWSRCVVVETTPSQDLGSGARPMAARWERPINNSSTYTIDAGSALTETTQGWSYFPGYAINLNTGERLNVFFGESSYDKQNNGDDMRWNPTSNFGTNGDRVGGRHYVYVSKTRYDGCTYIQQVLSNSTLPGGTAPTLYLGAGRDMREVYQDVAWVGVPMLSGAFLFDNPQEIPTDARVSLRLDQQFRSRETTTDIPVFTFSTKNIAAVTGDHEVATNSLLNQVRVVPNPYYAYSTYESSQLQTIVKFTNLPQKCKIRIYTLNGTLVRTYNKDSDSPEQPWDLKNQSGVPVASGVYLIHVDAGEIGETILKFFTVMPKIDLSSY